LGQPNNSPQLSLNEGGSCDSSNKLVELRKGYWETAKASSSIILKFLLEHLPIPVIGKELLGGCWRWSELRSMAFLLARSMQAPFRSPRSPSQCPGWPDAEFTTGHLLTSIG